MRAKTFALLAASLSLALHLFASDTPPPVIRSIIVTNTASQNKIKTVTFDPAPAIDQYSVRGSATVNGPYTNETAGVLNNFTYKVTNAIPTKFYSIGATPISSNNLLTANVLNRLAYGPSPDDLARLAVIGPQAYIDEQLAPETIPNNQETSVTLATNSGLTPPVFGWQQVSVTGGFSANVIYLYLTKAGAGYVDDVELRLVTNGYVTNIVGTNITIVTNVGVSTNLLVNGDFEGPAIAPWIVATNMVGSSLTTTEKHTGNQSLRIVATSPGNTSFNSLQQTFFTPRAANGSATNRCVLSFWYLAETNSSRIQSRLSGSGSVATGSDKPDAPEWIYFTATGNAGGTPAFYIYLSGAGDCYIDDIKLVAGSVPEVGSNILRNADFESPLTTNDWVRTANFLNSDISTTYAKSGNSSLHVVATAAGDGSDNSVTQRVSVVNGQRYTLSFWYLPSPNRTLTARLSGSLLSATPDTSPAGLRRKLDNIGSMDPFTGLPDDLPYSTAGLSDLRAWFCQNAVSSPRQLIEILTQFLENHFVTQNAKSRDYTDRFYDNGTLEDAITTEWEYREISRWRQALLNPNCTFFDLVKISAEGPAMIVYLDTVGSTGNGNAVANENYARELFELFCMGVDNGYDQNDIIVMSRAWTGWTIDIVDFENKDNPFATRTLRTGMYPGVGSGTTSNLVGIWTFVFNSAVHGTNRAPILSEWDPAGPATNPRPAGASSYPYAGGLSKIVPARFGAPWAGTPYRLVIPGGRTGTNGIQDGYDVLRHLADLPFTMEFISVKLCRLFVHDNFVHGVYDYTDPNRSPEAELVRQCMVAWNTPGGDGRKGNMRMVLSTIFNSDLFRSHGGSLQKIKTPLEFVASSVRALRAANPDGTFTAGTDGYSFSSPLSRMGGMSLFNRAEPDGYPESGPPWISAGTLDERVRFVQSLLEATTGGDAGNSVTDPVTLLKLKLPSNQWNNTTNVADFFLGLIYPGEGKANLDAYRNLAITFLDTADNGTSNLFTTLSNTGTTYNNRVRGMVAMLMTMQRFQEQ